MRFICLTLINHLQTSLRKVVFKPFTGLTKEQKLSIVGSLIGVTNKIHADDIYECMIDIT